MKNLKKMFILCSLALVFTVILADASQAAIMNVAAGKAVKVFNSVKMIIFIVGGFGLVGIAWQAIWGKMKWTWFAGLAVGLAILAAAGAIVNYASGDNMKDEAGNNTYNYDTFGKGDGGNTGYGF
jgi:vacuolar-type H+-ATPase subunit I/STV1